MQDRANNQGSGEYPSGWSRIKRALSRDWEQTKSDFTGTHGQDLDQQLGDTLKQAVGAAPIPRPGRRNHSIDFEEADLAYRFTRRDGRDANLRRWTPDPDRELSPNEAEWFRIGDQESFLESTGSRSWEMHRGP